jgi:hypothetical protein
MEVLIQQDGGRQVEFTPCGACRDGYCACPQACGAPEPDTTNPKVGAVWYVIVALLAVMAVWAIAARVGVV